MVGYNEEPDVKRALMSNPANPVAKAFAFYFEALNLRRTVGLFERSMWGYPPWPSFRFGNYSRFLAQAASARPEFVKLFLEEEEGFVEEVIVKLRAELSEPLPDFTSNENFYDVRFTSGCLGLAWDQLWDTFMEWRSKNPYLRPLLVDLCKRSIRINREQGEEAKTSLRRWTMPSGYTKEIRKWQSRLESLQR